MNNKEKNNRSIDHLTKPREMSSEEVSRFRKIVRDYLELDDQVRILSRAKRTRIQKRDLLGKFIMETLKSNRLEVIRLQKIEERLEMVRVERKTPLNHPFLKEKISAFYGSNKRDAQKLYAYMLDNRDSKVNYRLKRVRENKNKSSPLSKVENASSNNQPEEKQEQTEQIEEQSIGESEQSIEEPREPEKEESEQSIEEPKELREPEREEPEEINYHQYLQESIKEWERESSRSSTPYSSSFETDEDDEDTDYEITEDFDKIPERNNQVPDEISQGLQEMKIPPPEIDYQREVFERLNQISSQQMSSFQIPSQLKKLNAGGRIYDNINVNNN